MYHYKYVVQFPCILSSLTLGKSTGFALTAAGYVLGHSHKGRSFLAGAHGQMASVLFVPIALQLFLGIYLKLHIHEQTIRPWAVRLHGVVGKAYPILAWVQMLFGAIAFRGYCRDGNLGQCLAHYIMVRFVIPFNHCFYENLSIFRGADSSRMARSWRYSCLLASRGFVVVAAALTGGTRGLSCCGYVPVAVQIRCSVYRLLVPLGHWYAFHAC